MLPLMVLMLALQAPALPSGFIESQFGGAFAAIPNPTAMAFAPDGRLFVCQQDGRIRIIKNGTLLVQPFLSVPVDFQGERGLLGVAFDPEFSSRPIVYVHYTTPSAPVHNRVSRFTAEGDVAVANSEVVIFELDNLSSASNHNGGGIHFGIDGKLYIGVGQNGDATNAQSLNNVLGKMLRINSDGSIPEDNPFFSLATGKYRAIWAYGLRNPYTFAIQPGSGNMLINDVGQSTWEEINEGIAGANYGWPICEGVCVAAALFADPVLAYSHSGTGGCAITGGTFYNPTRGNFPAFYIGKYFFADLCGGFVGLFDPANRTTVNFASGIPLPVDIQVGLDGALYVLQIGDGGQVRRISSSNGKAPSIAKNPSNASLQIGQSVTFSVTAEGTAPLQYQWQRNNIDIPGASAASYALSSASASDNGAVFLCVVSNGFATVTSLNATATVIPRPATLAARNDHDGDGVADWAVFRQTQGLWYVLQSSNLMEYARQWGAPGDIPVPGDYDGDGKSDFAVWRESEGIWYVIASSSGVEVIRQWGTAGDIPVPGDYDGDGKSDFAVWRESEGNWYVIASSSGAEVMRQWGTAGDIPVPGDYDGDGKSDFAVWRESEGNWYVIASSSGVEVMRQWGTAGDIPVPGDYDGDGKTDFAVWRESEGIWYVIASTSGVEVTRQWGAPGDLPVPGDYDGDGKSDFAVWRESDGVWYVLRSADGAIFMRQWGAPGDLPANR